MIPSLDPKEPILEQTAWWIIARHPEWGASLVDYFNGWLAREDLAGARGNELIRQLLTFSTDVSIQELLAKRLGQAETPVETTLLLLEVIGEAPLPKIPAAWAETLRSQVLQKNEVVVRRGTVSFMPEGLDQQLGRDELRDLFAFLQSLK